MMGVGSAVIVDVSVGASVAVGMGVMEGVFVVVVVGMPIGVVVPSVLDEEVRVERGVGEDNVVTALTAIGVASPAFSIAHLPKPVNETTTARRMIKMIPVKVNPLSVVG